MGTDKSLYRLKFTTDKSMRSVDLNGYMTVRDCPISKEQVRRYRGDEIPYFETLDLDPTEVYGVLCPGEELEKAAPSFALIPLQLYHHIDSADDPQTDKRVGTTGEIVRYDRDKGYLRATLQITHKAGIRAIETGEAAEISSSYTYTPIQKKGTFRGEQYDFVMTDIQGNHVALVEVGRAGPDVRVLDAAPGRLPTTQDKDQKMGTTTAKRTRAAGKSKPAPRPANQKPRKLVVSDETTEQAIEMTQMLVAENADPQTIVAAVEEIVVASLEEATDPPSGDPDTPTEATDDDELERIIAGLPEETQNAIREYVARLREGGPGPEGMDEAGETDKERKEAAQDGARMTAMDAARIQKAAIDSYRTQMSEVVQAAEDVQPILRKTINPYSYKSASDIYKLALDAVGIPTTGQPPLAFKGMVSAFMAAQTSITGAHPLDGAFNVADSENETVALEGQFECLSGIKEAF